MTTPPRSECQIGSRRKLFSQTRRKPPIPRPEAYARKGKPYLAPERFWCLFQFPVPLLLAGQNTGVGDEGMRALAGMPRMEWLSLGNTRVGDEGLGHLGGLDRLEVLTLENTPITDAGLAHLGGLTRLRYLHLNNTRVTDTGLASLKGLVRLERLYLCDTDVTDAGLVNLEAMKNLYYLMLHNTLDPVLDAFRTTVKVSDAGLVHLRGLTGLRDGSLFLWNTSVTEEGIASLKEALPQLKQIAFGENRILGFWKGHPPRGRQP
jgi:hypothetical protein